MAKRKGEDGTEAAVADGVKMSARSLCTCGGVKTEHKVVAGPAGERDHYRQTMALPGVIAVSLGGGRTIELEFDKDGVGYVPQEAVPILTRDGFVFTE